MSLHINARTETVTYFRLQPRKDSLHPGHGSRMRELTLATL